MGFQVPHATINASRRQRVCPKLLIFSLPVRRRHRRLADCQVLTASRGGKGLELAFIHSVDVVIVDFMPRDEWIRGRTGT